VEGNAFVRLYIDLLSSGGSESPERLVSRMGVDITDPKFWEGGIDILREMVDEAGRLAEKVRACN